MYYRNKQSLNHQNHHHHDTSVPGCLATQERRASWSSSPKLSLLKLHPLDLPSSAGITSRWSDKRLGVMSTPSKSQVSVGVGWPKPCQKNLYPTHITPRFLENRGYQLKFVKTSGLDTCKKNDQTMNTQKILTAFLAIGFTLQIEIPSPCTSSCLFKGLWPFMYSDGLSRSANDTCDHLDCQVK